MNLCPGSTLQLRGRDESDGKSTVEGEMTIQEVSGPIKYSYGEELRTVCSFCSQLAVRAL